MTVLTFDRYPVDAGRLDEFQGLLRDALAALRSAPGLLWADAARMDDDDPSYAVWAEWRTGADADAWPGAEAFAADADPLLRGEPTHRRFTSA